MKPLVVLVLGLATAGALPASAMVRRSFVIVFLAPLIGTALAAVAAVIELGLGGSLPGNYIAVAVIANAAVIAWWWRHGAARRSQSGLLGGWFLAAVGLMLGCLAVPMTTLRTPMLGWDPSTMWLTHALMMYGGHQELRSGLQNTAYMYSNPDYPPLVPAASALAFSFFGHSDLHLFVDMTVLLSGCALGVLGSGIAAAGITAVAAGREESRGWPARVAAVALGGSICLVGFAVSGQWGIIGYTDLLWAAAAAAAVVWGLVLQPSEQALAVAWVCTVVASMTKNEGLTTAVMILLLISLRYRPLTLRGPKLRTWAERAAFAAVPALPGLAWAAVVRLLGIHDNFFASSAPDSLLSRAQATIAGMAVHLAVAPVAAAVLLAGCSLLRGERARAGLASPAWLWLSGLGSLAAIFATYVGGDLDIHGWLSTSVDRTTIFAQVVLYSDLAVWLVLAVDGACARGGQETAFRRQLAPEVRDGPGEAVAERNGRLPAQ